jgi:ADP-heptose:LPS heptosyltransferase
MCARGGQRNYSHRLQLHHTQAAHSRNGRSFDILKRRSMSGLPVLKQLDPESVVIFRALQLGDMLCSVPALRALRAAVPHARIALVGLPWGKQFAARFSRYIDEFFVFPGHPAFPEQPVQKNLLPGFYETMRLRKFSLALQMHGSGEVSNGIVKSFGAHVAAGHAVHGMSGDGRFHCFPYPDSGPEPLRLLELASLLGAPALGTHLEFPLTERDWEELERSGLGAGLKPGAYVCIHPGARFSDKCWPPQRFAEIADRLALEFGLATVLTGSDREIALTSAVASYMKTPAINAAAPISIGAMAALMSGARLLVCNDTGVSHIAAGLGLKSVVIFNQADMDRWAPLDRRLHRCIRDPAGEYGNEVLALARLVLSEADWR